MQGYKLSFYYKLSVTDRFNSHVNSPNVAACTVPTLSLQPGTNLRVQQWTHACFIQTAGFHQVDNRETICDTGLHVLHTEVEPLCVLFGVHVMAQSELIVIMTTKKRKYHCLMFTVYIYIERVTLFN